MSNIQVKAFMASDDYALPNKTEVAPVFEISDIAMTYSKTRQQHYSVINPLKGLHVFELDGATMLSQDQVETIIGIVNDFNNTLTVSNIMNKQQAIILFINNYNASNPTSPVSDFNYSTVVPYNNVRNADYLTFKVKGVTCNIWTSDEVFRVFYPSYDINIVLPFTNFANLVKNASEFINALSTFNLVDFNRRIEEDKNNHPTTYTRWLNVPYKIAGTNVTKDCYFAFNIYGLQGNYDHILKLELLRYLTDVIKIPAGDVEAMFPSILNINEFFIIPKWEHQAIPSQIGEIGINSQVSLAFSEAFDTNKYIKLYYTPEYLRANTNNVPFTYNNILLHVVNGYYSELPVKSFSAYYNDFIAVPTTSPDFSRMSQRTQRFVTMAKNLLEICNSNTSNEMFNKILQNNNYKFTVITRDGITYISYSFEDHQYYCIPRYVYKELMD